MTDRKQLAGETLLKCAKRHFYDVLPAADTFVRFIVEVVENVDGVVISNSVVFGPWRYDRRQGRLLRMDDGNLGAQTAIGSRAADILAVLLREPGALVSKDALMDAVWPGVTVEANNLTVQIAALRRLLDEGATGPSFIQTVPGRGYRLLCRTDEEGEAEPAADVPPVTAPTRSWASRRRFQSAGVLAAVVLAAVAVAVWPQRSPALPRMSTLVLPFDSLGSVDGDRVAAALADGLKATLSMSTPVQIVNGKASRSFDDRKTPVEAIGRQLGARYVVTGSVQRLDDLVRVNVQIVSTETAETLWADRFDQSFVDQAAGQEKAIGRLESGIVHELVPLEAARSQAERPGNPDAFDLVLRANAIGLLPPTPTGTVEMRNLYQKALLLDPASAFYRLLLVSATLDAEDYDPQGRKDVFERTATLLAEAQASDPGFWLVSLEKLHWLAWQERRRCSEVVDFAEQFLQRYRAVSVGRAADRWLADCQTVLGHAETAVAGLDQALTREPHPYASHDYRNLQFALLLLGRYDKSVHAGERALAENPNDAGSERARLNRRLAAGLALGGRLDEARRRAAEAMRIDPFFTVRGTFAPENASPIYASQIERLTIGYRLAGLRDHAEEAADFGVAPDDRLHQEYTGPTPLTLPGVTTVNTDDLVRMLAGPVLIIDALTNFAGPSLLGAVGLRYVGAGGELNDLAQDRLRATMQALTKSDLDRPIVAVGWNSESFDGRNLARRLIALGYRNVFWYRGGREAWQTRGLKQATLVPLEW